MQPVGAATQPLEDDSRMTRANLKTTAALGSMEDSYGNFERRYATDVLLVPPRVMLDRDKLVWRLRPRRDRDKVVNKALRRRSRADAARSQWNARHVLPGTNMLRAFANLVDAPPERVLAFARRWGPLGCCRHGLPSSHSLDCAPCGWDGQGGWEPLARWDFFTRRAQAVLFVASRMRDGSTGSIQELQPLAFDLAKVLLAAGRLESKKVCPPDWWALVIGVVNQWIEDGGVRPRLLLSGDVGKVRPRLVLTPTWRFPEPEFSLFGALGMQLAFAVAGERGLAFCSTCCAWFEPGRQLRAGVRHYCPDCARRGKWRSASAAYRARQKKSSSSQTAKKPRRHRHASLLQD